VIGRMFEGWHAIVLVVVLLLLFGHKRLPDAARGIGQSLRIFKSEVKELQSEDRSPSGSERPSGRSESGEPGSVTDRPSPSSEQDPDR
jgi:sec-independent protein translocase protein TatA